MGIVSISRGNNIILFDSLGYKLYLNRDKITSSLSIFILLSANSRIGFFSIQLFGCCYPQNNKRLFEGIGFEIVFENNEMYMKHIKRSLYGHDPNYPSNNWEIQPTICKNLILRPKTSEKRNTT